MKHIKFYKISLVVLLLIVSCSDDILDRFPEDAASDATFFRQATDFENFANGLYDYRIGTTNRYVGVLRRVAQNEVFATLEVDTDNIIAQEPHDGIQQRSNSGVAGQTNNTWNDNYEVIRSVNYMLSNQDNLENRDATGDHYIGEGYFMRAFFYYRLLQNFGGVPYIDEVLGTTSENLYKPRESRDFIATKIIEDLDEAIALLQWQGEGAAVPGRINKEAALHLKTRVGLYEGTWERYHSAKGTPFAVGGSNGSVFLNAAVDAGDMLITHQGTAIYQGPAGDEYSTLFNNENAGGIPGVFLYRDYSVDLGQSGNRPRGMGTGQSSITKTALDNYLMSDGLPQEISTVTPTVDIADQNSVINNRDPRLRQTVYTPDRGSRTDLFVDIPGEGFLGFYQPANFQNIIATGYYWWKGAVFTSASLDFNDADDIIFRYGESLLNYAEAKAILGTITQGDIDATVNVLRNRVGAVNMDLAAVNGWSIAYSEQDGYDPSETNIVNEIRRERRMELMVEGFRSDDLKRWALYEDVINGFVPVSAYYQELVDFYADEQNVADSGYPTDDGTLNQVRFVEGVNSGQIDGYLTPYWQEPDFSTATSEGYFINPDRDYLQAIPQVEIDFYQQEAGVTLEQNPGWL
nr:RagB/SusD family nutrient uptake outer membrane protein [uncultured Allomuricauda sp.]